jgi:signal transduction histidine kinase/CheY-like chemotaxis protein/HD-like signal output (HDOD) protein
MDALELKRRIKLMRDLPALPSVAREVLLHAGPEADGLEDLAATVSCDPELAQVLTRAVAGAVDARTAVFALGGDGVRRVLTRHALRRMFPGETGALDRTRFWRHAVSCAGYAEQLAARLHSPHAHAAYVAGLLHNVGKLVLDTLVPDAYARVVDAVDNAGVPALEAERSILGVDHTLAGKWTAENWGLPEPYVSAIWLHHHPSGALDETHYPVQLVEIVRLAGVLAHASGGAAQGAHAPPAHLLERLGLSLRDLEEIAANPVPAVEPQPVGGERSEAADPRATAQLQRRVRRLKALEKLQESLGGEQHLGAMLEATASRLREGFVTSWGFCCAADEEFACLEGRWWQGRQEPLQAFVTPLRADAEPGGDARREALPGALREVLALATREAWQEGGFAEMLRWPGFVVAPILAEGRSFGQILLDCSGPGGGFGEDDFGDLRLFGRVTGMAIAHLRAKQHLRERNEEMAEALWRKEEEFRQRMRDARTAGIAKLAAGASHEINNPLAIISGRAQVMLNRAMTPEDRKGLETIIDQCRRASQVLTGLMQFARPPEPKLEPLPPGFVLRQIVAGLRPRLERRGIQVIEHYFERLPRVRMDRRRIEQALMALIDNAERAMSGGGTLTVRALPAEGRRFVKVQVSDTGPGIASEIRDEVFEPFFTTHPQGEATGLGLAVCQGIVDSHGGRIELEQRGGRGATFNVLLPAVAEVAAPPEPVAHSPEPAPETTRVSGRETPSPVPQEAGWTGPDFEPVPAPAVQARAPRTPAGMKPAILVVDDDADLREVLKETFRGRGCDALGASDVNEARAMFFGRRTDLVILDIRLPRQDGLGLLREIRAADAEVPVIVVTGLASGEELEEARNLGARICLHKPFELKRLLSEVEEALHSRSAA